MPTPGSIQRTYLVLLLGNTLAASLIWGINTIFLLDAGLSNLEAFAANAFFTAGMVLFEVPTGVVADTVGRRASYLLGTVTVAASTLLYVLLWKVHAPFWQWAIVSILIGLGFTFFSGAVEAWLVDALKATGFTGALESVFGRGQVVTGVAMLTGSVLGGLIAQATNLGVPFVLRGLILVAMFVVAFRLMHDVGFSPEKGGRVLTEIRKIASASIEYGLRVPAVRWLMLEALFTGGVGIYGFYALQPYLLKLYGDPHAYVIAGLAAAIVAGAQILGGIAAPRIRGLFRRRTSALIATATVGVVVLGLMGILQNFWVVIGLVVIWSLIFAASMPIRQTYMNGTIPSRQRALDQGLQQGKIPLESSADQRLPDPHSESPDQSPGRDQRFDPHNAGAGSLAKAVHHPSPLHPPTVLDLQKVRWLPAGDPNRVDCRKPSDADDGIGLNADAFSVRGRDAEPRCLFHPVPKVFPIDEIVPDHFRRGADNLRCLYFHQLDPILHRDAASWDSEPDPCCRHWRRRRRSAALGLGGAGAPRKGARNPVRRRRLRAAVAS